MFTRTQKGLVALLSVSMLFTAACSDSKIKQLNNKNKSLEKKVSELEAQNASSKSKLSKAKKEVAELEERSDKLSAKLDELNKSGVTLESLTEQIEEKRTLKANAEEALKLVQSEKAQAEQDLAQARADEAEARKMADQKIADADKKIADAKAEQEAAQNRIDQANAEEKKIEQLNAQLDERQKQIDKAAKEWRQLYSKYKLDAVFDRLTDEGKMNEAVTFQYSIVGVNLNVVEINKIRARVQKVQSSSSNLYKQDYELKPSQKLVVNRINALAKKVATEKSKSSTTTDKIIANAFAVGTDNYTLNDSYLAKTTGSELISLRNDLLKYNSGKRAVFMIPRIVEKLSVSMVMKVRVNKGDHVLDKDIKKAFTATLAKPKAVQVDLSKEIDISVPMDAMFSSKDCKNLSADCLKALADAGFLNKVVTVNGQPQPIKSYLYNQLLKSADQTQKFTQQLNDGRQTFLGQLMNSIVNTVTTKTCYADDLTEYDCSDKNQNDSGNDRTVEQITIEFAVNQIQDLPSSGMVPLDFAMNTNIEKLALNISDDKLHIQLPFKKARSLTLNFEKVAKDKVTNTYGETKRGEEKEALSRILGAKNSLYMDYAGALK